MSSNFSLYTATNGNDSNTGDSLENKEIEFNVFPNPFKDEFIIIRFKIYK